MGLDTNAIVDWLGLRKLFLSKYKEYCRAQDMKRDDIFKMTQREDKTLEDYVARFVFNL